MRNKSTGMEATRVIRDFLEDYAKVHEMKRKLKKFYSNVELIQNSFRLYKESLKI